jgi:ATP-dependent DNA ligase
MVDDVDVLAVTAGRRLVVDGELVAFDDRGRTSFERLQERIHVGDTAAARRSPDDEVIRSGPGVARGIAPAR